MLNNNIKFVLNLDDCNYHIIEDAFNKSKGILNWQFDDNYNAILIDEDIDFQFTDVSNLEKGQIKDIINSFFNFTFDTSVNVSLYKFLVLKDNKKSIILANISSLIFDYTSINDFCELFNVLNKSPLKNDLESYYNNIKYYINSPDFEKDANYWKHLILNSAIM